MKRFLLIIGIGIVIWCTGCSGIRTGLIDLNKEDLANVETGRQVSINGLKTWAWNVGFIYGALGEAKIGSLPMESVKAMGEIKQIAQELGYWDEIDYKLAYSVGAKARAINSVTQEMVKIYAPDVIRYIPSLLKMIP